MDIALERKAARFPVKRQLLAAGIALLLFSGYQFLKPSSEQRVARNSLLFGTVRRGDMSVEVEGYGVLRSDKQKLLTALTSATVEEIVLKPGATVTADSVILRLGNPELLQEVERAEQNLIQQKANLRQLMLNNSRSVMTEDSTRARLTASYESTKFRRQGEEKLVEQGIVSRLDYNTTRLQEAQLAERIRILNEQRAQLLLMQQESVKIQQEQINQAMSMHATAKNRVERLVVKAGLDGILQNLPVELGQSVPAGQALALVGSTQDLVALVRVPQTRAERVKVGQAAIIDTRTEQVPGKVTRIDPAVTEGTVTVEIAFAGAPPVGARPELSVNSRIVTETLRDVLYVERPVNVAENSKARVFKVSDGSGNAAAAELTFGVENDRYIQVAAGAAVGEKLILSDMKGYEARELSIER
jgi:HlyD family secretion protein